jgi:RNA binding exosome subunit
VSAAAGAAPVSPAGSSARILFFLHALQRSVARAPVAHNAVLRVHCHATEEEERVRQALAVLAGEAEPRRSLAEGHHKNPIVVLEVVAQKRAADAVWARIRAARSVAEQLAAEAERRTDDAGTFYARFDKQRAYLGELALTHGDDAIHLRSKLAAHPAKKPQAVAVVRRFLGEGSSPPPQP